MLFQLTLAVELEIVVDCNLTIEPVGIAAGRAVTLFKVELATLAAGNVPEHCLQGLLIDLVLVELSP